MFSRVFLAGALAIAVLPATAGADWLFTPYVGGNVGGATVDPQPNFGVSAGWMGEGALGFEFDAAWAPDFFDTGNDDASALLSDSSVATYMLNVVAGVPVGGSDGMGIRPYGSAGIGGIRSQVESDLGLVDVENTDFGWNAGAGVLGFFNDNFGLRGDVRYFRSFQGDPGDGDDGQTPILEDFDAFRFWRVAGGVVLRWGMATTP